LPPNPDAVNPKDRHDLDEHREEYKKNIVYGTINEFGFDYLRDNMVVMPEERVQQEHGFVIVDEADAVLIDEARIPLISEQPVDEEDFEPKWYQEFARLAARMETGNNSDAIEGYDYIVGNRNKYELEVTEKGLQFIEDQLGIITEGGLFDEAGENAGLVEYLYTALEAKEFYQRDRDYIVEDGKVQIVDKFTHRVLSGRRYHEGIHQALEAKEGVDILPDSEKLAEISIQNYVKLYNKKAGMSGTAATDAKEFNDMYGMQVVKIPTRLPSRRVDHAPVIYKTEAAKFEGIVDEIWERYQTGQPVLVGTVSVEKSEFLSEMLNKRGIPHDVLNAKNHAGEAAIIAEAGRRGKVTISTNMAGRGVDIKLGGDAEYLAEDALAKKHLPPAVLESPNLARQKQLLKIVRATEYKKLLQDYQQQTVIDAEVVKAAGGLFVLGTEYHESRRIDNQLRGRAGRQGDPGETQFYLSLEDSFLQKLTPERAASIKAGFDYKRVPDISPLRSRRSLEKIFISAQHQMEENGFRDRKEVVDYDTVLDEQRKTFYRERRKLLEGDANELQKQLQDRITDVVKSVVTERTKGHSMNWDIEGIITELRELYPPTGSLSDFAQQIEINVAHLIQDRDFLRGEITEYLLGAYNAKVAAVREEYGESGLQYFLRVTLLQYLDLQWKTQLMKMEDLRHAVPLRGYGGRDPKVEFANEGQQLFAQMIQQYNKDVAKNFFAMQLSPS
jgi:preprotein translocase subunit SecA